MNCSPCVHKIGIAGNCHIGCSSPEKAKLREKLWPGCGAFPFSFDPNIVVSCEGFSDNPEDTKPRPENPLLEIVRLMF